MNSLGSYITSFTLYKFIKDITASFTSFPAYRLGIIDANGIMIKKPTTGQEQQAYSPYYQMIINVKKIFGKVPDPKTRAELQSVVTALKLFGEETEKNGGDGDALIKGVEKYLKENGIDLEESKMNLLFENPPANSMGAGAFGFGIPISQGGDGLGSPTSRSNTIAGFDSLLGYEGFGKGLPQILRRKDPHEKSRKRFNDIINNLRKKRKEE
tara:strand:+ start:1704 stop:2339 length:636 start_codon:yes stop_codon:yes gene_type:complete